MGNYAIMRWGKIKFDGVASSEYHQRTELHKNCEHPELREQNFTFRQFEDETLRQTTKRLMAAQQERTGRAVRKDATVMVDFVLTFSPEMVGKVDMGAWFKANVDWLHREFGAKNLLRLDMHFHESSPHLHAFVAPLDEKGNFNFKKHVRHISQLVAMQDRYAKAMEQFGLERGQNSCNKFQRCRSSYNSCQRFRNLSKRHSRNCNDCISKWKRKKAPRKNLMPRLKHCSCENPMIFWICDFSHQSTRLWLENYL